MMQRLLFENPSIKTPIAVEEGQQPHIHVFAMPGVLERSPDLSARILRAVQRLSEGTRTTGLVVAAYLLRRRDFWQGHAYTRPVTRRVFEQTGRRWAFVTRFETPCGLPARFPLIRLAFGVKDAWPRSVRDVYGWEMQCDALLDLVAYTFAHELHHYRKYHLGLHPREGEQAACRWGLAQAARCGFRVRGVRYRVSPSRPRVQRAAIASPHEPHFARLRALPPGALVRIAHDTGRCVYLGQEAVKVRTLRGNSFRMAIRTADGREWRWPMQWLAAVEM